jgi:hypothetical protein
MARRRRPLPPGQIEHLARPFDRALDVEAFAAQRFHDLKTGEWGIRRYLPASPPRRPLFVVLRGSDDVLFKGKRVPFANQLDDIAKLVAARANGREVVAIFWDCESASDFREVRRKRQAIERQAFSACLTEAGEPEHPCAEIWVWKSDRLARGWRYLPHLMELQHQRVALMAATGRIRRDFLPMEITMAQRERDNWRRRAITGKTSLAVRFNLPPTRRIPVGWKAAWRHQPPIDRTDYDPVHDPEAMPAWEAALTGLRFHGWSWERATDHLNAAGVLRLSDRDQTADARRLAWNPRLVRSRLRGHTWWVGRGKWTDRPMDVDEDGEEVEGDPVEVGFAVPPATVDDPDGGRRPLTAADLDVIFAVAERAPYEGRPRGGWAARDGRGKRPLSERLRCVECDRLFRHQRVESRLGDYYLLRCDSPQLARELGRERCPRRPITIRETVALEAVWASVTEAFLDPTRATAEARRRLAEVEARPALADATALRRSAEALTEAEARLLVKRALEPGNEAAYDLALLDLRRRKRGEQEALEALAQEAAEAEAERRGLRATVEAFAAYEAALSGRDARARAAWEAAFARATPAQRGRLIRDVVAEATVDAAGTYRVRVVFDRAAEGLGALVPDERGSRTPFTQYKSLPPLTVSRRAGAA